MEFIEEFNLDELKSIEARYQRRKAPSISAKYSVFSAFHHFSRCERDFWMNQLLMHFFPDTSDISVMEIGAGSGGNLDYFLKLGVPRENIFANELLPDRAEMLSRWLPSSQIHCGNVLDLSYHEKFDIVFQSVVMSSILENDFRRKVAKKMWDMLKPGGVILWYDFIYNNPSNPDVQKVPWKEVLSLFPEAKVVMKKKVTLAPPLGRRVGRFYNFLNFPFLRTHYVGVLQKSP